ncbi:MAG TPA: hypothetical protein VGW12_14245 [Pyrinomonadaceae bacterium]|nr:hypothetical protein [Pyrinomonadaceae bacterium]
MKKSLHRVALSLVLCTLLGSVALAGGKSKTVTFSQDIKVGGTLVKRGTYVVTFDEKTNELTVRSGKKVVAKANGRLDEQKINYPAVYVTAKDKESNIVLSGVKMDGRLVIVGGEATGGTTTTAVPQQ